MDAGFSKLSGLIESVEAIAESIDDNSYMHPLCSRVDLAQVVKVIKWVEMVVDVQVEIRTEKEMLDKWISLSPPMVERYRNEFRWECRADIEHEIFNTAIGRGDER